LAFELNKHIVVTNIISRFVLYCTRYCIVSQDDVLNVATFCFDSENMPAERKVSLLFMLIKVSV